MLVLVILRHLDEAAPVVVHEVVQVPGGVDVPENWMTHRIAEAKEEMVKKFPEFRKAAFFGELKQLKLS